jgi:hypothetical protein
VIEIDGMEWIGLDWNIGYGCVGIFGIWSWAFCFIEEWVGVLCLGRREWGGLQFRSD